jgi:uncharacterized protein (DUF488 family)
LRIYTLGYQGLSQELYVQALVNAGVGVVIDVREHAWSQRPAFVKSTLRAALLQARIEYRHIKSAGNPSKNRKTARSAAECLSRYRTHLSQNLDCLRELLMIINEAEQVGRPASLTCYERSYLDCHRSVLIEELLNLEARLMPIHLEPTIVTRLKPQGLTRPSLATTAYLAPALLPFR